MVVTATKTENWRKNIRDDGFLGTLSSSADNQAGESKNEEGSFWTGLPPSQGAPGVQKDGKVTSLALLNLENCTRQQVLDYFNNTWTLTEMLFSALRGVDEMSWDDLSKNDMEWPTLKEVWDYRRQVYSLVKNIIETHPALDDLPITWDKSMWAIPMCCEHERIHLETSSVLMRELPLRLLKKPKQWPENAPFSPAEEVPPNHFINVPGGDVTIGKPHNFPSYGWDNEYGSRHFHVRPFAATAMLIRNGEFLQFVKDKGYHNPDFWTKEGWKWKSFRNAKWPTFWVPHGPAGLHQYKLRLIFEEVDLPLDLPAVVNWHEAKAYCGWLSHKEGLSGKLQYRLMTEVEHHRLRDTGATSTTGEDPIMNESGYEMKNKRNLNLAYGSEGHIKLSVPTERGFFDTSGNVWQWCEDFFAALPESMGVHPIYDDFSTPCYDGQHNIIVGGSFISTGDEASIFARFHFRPHFFQHAGFRVVKPTGPIQLTHMDSPPPHVGNWNPSSMSRTSDQGDQVSRELMTYYQCIANGHEENIHLPFQLGSFSKEYTEVVIKLLSGLECKLNSALEIGCSVGGICFEMAKHCESVVGVDSNAQLIQAALDIQQNGVKTVSRKEEGDFATSAQVETRTPKDLLSRVTFRQMDPCSLQPDLGDFDCVLLTNVLERIPSPHTPLARMGGARGLVKPGGFLIVACSGDWSEQYSGKQLWLEGRTRKDGQQVNLMDSLSSALGKSFELKRVEWIPMVVPLSSRKFVTDVINVSAWMRLARE